MKKTKMILGSAIFLAGAVFTSCSNSAQKVENEKEKVVDANESLEEANEDYAEDMAVYRKENAERILANDKRIAEFKAKIAVQKNDAKLKYEEQIGDLERKNIEFKKKLDSYEEPGADKWIAFKAEFSRDMDELGKALKDLTVKNNK
jgi:DNA-directed RNA polymerase alpha subunit